MSRSPYRVSIVLDRDFAERIADLARTLTPGSSIPQPTRPRSALSALVKEFADCVTAQSVCVEEGEERARAVLLKETQGRGLAAFGASEALKRWEEGTWQLDPE